MMVLISITSCLPGPPSTPRHAALPQRTQADAGSRQAGPRHPPVRTPQQEESDAERARLIHTWKGRRPGLGGGVGLASRKASGRTPGRKGLEVSGRAAWTGWASSLGPPHAGQLPCLSQLGNPRHFLAHAGVGEAGRRRLLCRPRAGGVDRWEERAAPGAPGPPEPHLSPEGTWWGAHGQGWGQAAGTLGQRTPCRVGRGLGTHTAGSHIRDLALSA